MSQGCISCTNQPGDNGSLGSAGHEGTVTPMVVGIIIGTVAVFLLVVCALFYCVKLENHKYRAKIGELGSGGGGGGGGDDGESVDKSRPSSGTVVSASVRAVGGGENDEDEDETVVGRREVLPGRRRRSFGAVGASVGGVAGVGGGAGRGDGKRRLFGWGRKNALAADNLPVTAIEMV